VQTNLVVFLFKPAYVRVYVRIVRHVCMFIVCVCITGVIMRLLICVRHLSKYRLLLLLVFYHSPARVYLIVVVLVVLFPRRLSNENKETLSVYMYLYF